MTWWAFEELLEIQGQKLLGRYIQMGGYPVVF